MASEYIGLLTRVIEYKKVVANVHAYRQVWKDTLKDFIMGEVKKMATATELSLTIAVQDQVGNLEAVTCSLGRSASGIYERIDADTNKPLIKHHGTLVYQQLFNGKIQVMIAMPYIEGFGDPPPPKVIGIYRPQELKLPFLERHMEEFIKTVTAWEDFDDDEQTHTPIGFQHPKVPIDPDS